MTRRRDRLELSSLVGPAGQFAIDEVLTTGAWYQTDIPRARLEQLLRRSDVPAIRSAALWIGIALAAAAEGILLWGSLWALPCSLVYGVLDGSASDSRWHEAGHGAAFRTRWMDQFVDSVACSCMMRDPTIWRWQHTRHHTGTPIVRRGAEIQAMRPARVARILLDLFGLVDVPRAFGLVVVHARGRLTAEEQTFVPEQGRDKVYRTSRIWLAIYLATVLTAVATHSWLPVVLVGGPRLDGAFMHVICGLTQHAGLGENVLDHRLNTRTVLMGPVNRFLSLNMNDHIEHHMFPMDPSHQLPALLLGRSA